MKKKKPIIRGWLRVHHEYTGFNDGIEREICGYYPDLRGFGKGFAGFLTGNCYKTKRGAKNQAQRLADKFGFEIKWRKGQ